MHKCNRGACGWRFCAECCNNHKELPKYQPGPKREMAWASMTEEAQGKLLASPDDKKGRPHTKEILGKSAVNEAELESLTYGQTPKTALGRVVKTLAGGTLAKHCWTAMATEEDRKLSFENWRTCRRRSGRSESYARSRTRVRSACFPQGKEAAKNVTTTETLWGPLRKDRMRQKRQKAMQKSLIMRGLQPDLYPEPEPEWLTWPSSTWLCRCGQQNMPKEKRRNGTRKRRRCQESPNTTFIKYVMPCEGFEDDSKPKHRAGPRNRDAQVRQRQEKARRDREQERRELPLGPPEVQEGR